MNAAAQLLGEQKRLFWQRLIIPGVLRSDNIDVQYVADQLLESERAAAAVNLCGHTYGNLPVSAGQLASAAVSAYSNP